MVNPRPVDTVLGVVAHAPQLSAGSLTSRESRGLRSRAALLRVAMPGRVAGAAHRVQGCSVEQPDLGRAVPQCDALPKAPVVRPIAEPGRQRCRVPAAIGRVAEKKEEKKISRNASLTLLAHADHSRCAVERRSACRMRRSSPPRSTCPRWRWRRALGPLPARPRPGNPRASLLSRRGDRRDHRAPQRRHRSFFCSKTRAAPWWAPALQGCTYKAVDVESLLTAGSLR